MLVSKSKVNNTDLLDMVKPTKRESYIFHCHWLQVKEHHHNLGYQNSTGQVQIWDESAATSRKCFEPHLPQRLIDEKITARGPKCWLRSVVPFPELWGTPTNAKSGRFSLNSSLSLIGHRKNEGTPHQYRFSIISRSFRFSHVTNAQNISGVLHYSKPGVKVACMREIIGHKVFSLVL